MFRPPEYAALINPAIAEYTENVIVHTEAVAAYFQSLTRETLTRKMLLYEDLNRLLSRCGPKDWSPIGEYKFKAE